MNKKEFISRLKYAMKLKSITQNQLSLLSGLNKGSISSYISGKYLPKQDKIFLFSEILNVNPQWLMCESDDINISNNFNDTNNNSYYFIDQSISAGAPNLIDGTTNFEKINLPDLFLGKYAYEKDIVVLRVNGESMNKVIPNGSFIFLKQNISIFNISFDDIIVFSYHNEYSMKKFYNDKKNKEFVFSPHSYETCFKELRVSYENAVDLKIIGKVVTYIVNL